jgi:hypothetical protein
LLFSTLNIWAVAGGSITRTVTDMTGDVVPSAKLTLVNQAQQTTYHAVSNAQGVFLSSISQLGGMTLLLPSLFSTKRLTSLIVDTDASLRTDIALSVGENSETVMVNSGTNAQVDTSSTHLGEVVSGVGMTALPLNGCSYTDLLSIQPGVAPVSAGLAENPLKSRKDLELLWDRTYASALGLCLELEVPGLDDCASCEKQHNGE